MFERLFSSIGIGSTRVNTVLFQDKIERNKEVQGEVHVFGGKAAQTISEIYIHVDTEFHRFDDEMTEFRDVTEPILEIKITEPFVIQPNEEKKIPFSFTLPYYTPVTFKEQTIHIQTELDINYFNHPVETHDFEVIDPLIDLLNQYLIERGYYHNFKSGQCRYKLPTESNPTHCLQAFHLTNDQGKEVYFVGNDQNIHLYVQENNHLKHYEIKRDLSIDEQLLTLPVAI
ncbi:sporulation protein [Halalkalibacter krulwichiae]|uniref:Sporulation-control protein spo0M n=1 Tax=Halalkalibacter krulwichiae TaxID=199441 RepID=A0A1X9M817_9BACI|nr:sporulation protein [Halalkalibacter krulwichiae]ARK29585.1 Sporulation-control protein spo0M [Halalkalibacter krulwichiae]